MEKNIDIFMAVLLGCGVLFLLGRGILQPIKFVIKFVFKVLIGLTIIIFLNEVFGKHGIVIPLNFINGTIIAILGLPGIVLAILIYFL